MSTQADHLSEPENLADLMLQMNPEDLERYKEFTHLRGDPGYVGRVYIVYKPTGLTSSGQHKDPEILGQVKIVSWASNAGEGSHVVLEDMMSGARMEVGHIPMRLFEYDAFVCVPPYQRIRFEARRVGQGIQRSTIFSLTFKTKVRSSYYSAGVTFVESPKSFRSLYPDTKVNINFI